MGHFPWSPAESLVAGLHPVQWPQGGDVAFSFLLHSSVSEAAWLCIRPVTLAGVATSLFPKKLNRA